MLDETVAIHQLFDAYGTLLTERQRRVLELRLFEDWSLGEIAEELNVSRQAVHDLVQRVTQQLQEYEQKLGIVAEAQARRDRLRVIERTLRSRYELDEEFYEALHGLVDGYM